MKVAGISAAFPPNVNRSVRRRLLQNGDDSLAGARAEGQPDGEHDPGHACNARSCRFIFPSLKSNTLGLRVYETRASEPNSRRERRSDTPAFSHVGYVDLSALPITSTVNEWNCPSWAGGMPRTYSFLSSLAIWRYIGTKSSADSGKHARPPVIDASESSAASALAKISELPARGDPGLCFPFPLDSFFFAVDLWLVRRATSFQGQPGK